jgi:hypothetical protein
MIRRVEPAKVIGSKGGSVETLHTFDEQPVLPSNLVGGKVALVDESVQGTDSDAELLAHLAVPKRPYHVTDVVSCIQTRSTDA